MPPCVERQVLQSDYDIYAIGAVFRVRFPLLYYKEGNGNLERDLNLRGAAYAYASLVVALRAVYSYLEGQALKV